ISPMIMKVAVPPEKHSPRFGQEASSQTLCSLCLRSNALIRATSGDVDSGTRIQSGLRGTSSVGRIFTGMRATLSAPRSFTPGCSGWGRLSLIWICVISLLQKVALCYGARTCSTTVVTLLNEWCSDHLHRHDLASHLGVHLSLLLAVC